MKIPILLCLSIVSFHVCSQVPNLHWTYQDDGKSYYEDRGILVSFDSTGNVITAGYVDSGCTGLDISVTKYSASGDTLWSVTYNGSTSELENDIPNSIAVDAVGNIYLSGISRENSFDHAVTLKFNSNGDLQWAQRYLVSESVGNDIAVDASGNVIMCGYRSIGNSMDFLVIKYNSAGTQQWIANYTNGNYDEAVALGCDITGNIYVTGKRSGVNFNFDWATVKYNPAGVQQWVDIFTNATTGYSEMPVDLELDAAGNIYVAGSAPLLSLSNNDYYVIKYDQLGNRIWEESYNYTPFNSDDFPVDMAVDYNGNVFVTGISNGLGTGQDICTIKINSSGNFVWDNRVDSIQQSDYARAVVVDPSGDFIYVTGDVSVLPLGIINRDIIVQKIDTSGTTAIQQFIDGPGNSFDVAYDIATNVNGNVAVAGMTSMNTAANANGDVYTGTFDSQLASTWVRNINGDGFANDQGTDMVVDTSGNSYVCGFTQGGDVTFEDLVVFKVSPNGQRLWEFVYRGNEETSSEKAVAITIDQQYNVYVTGTIDTSTGSNYRDIYTAKLDPNGQLLWEHIYNGSAGGADYPVGIVVDNSGVSYVAATTINTSTGLDATLISYNLTGGISWETSVDKGGFAELFNTMTFDDTQTFIYCAGGYLPPTGHLSDGLLVKFDLSGSVVWDTIYDYSAANNDLDFFSSIDIDNSGNVFVAGQSNLNFVAAKYSPAGNPEWIQNYSHSNFPDSATVIAIDVNDDVIVAGTFGQSVEADYGIVKYSNDGTLIWDERYANSAGSDDILTGMTLDDDGGIYVTGWETSAFSTNYNFMTLKYDSAGTFKYELNWSGTNGVEPDYGKKIGLDAAGNIYVMGDANENCFGNTFVNGFRWNIQVLRYGQGVFSGVGEFNVVDENTTVYPNPATDEFYIKFPAGKFGSMPVEVMFYDITGKLINNTIISEYSENNINAKGWKSGLVFYHASNAKYSESGKILILEK